ncbi:restriction endonuclease subunit S [Microcoleus sp. S36b_A3]|uniref:restriction endonuclease subunit S n=1 Tax=unclassified Microcoleus TaxID=2642155 RepID=UPI002FD721B9
MKKTIKNGWRKVKLKEVCREITVGHVGSMAKEYVDKGIPFLRSQNILPFSLELSSVKYITPEFHGKLKKSALLPGDVGVVRTGYPGIASVIPSKLSICNCADLVIIRPSEELNAKYLTCVFNSTWGQGIIAGNLVGVAQQHFNVSAAKEMEVNLPSRQTQDKIAAIIYNYNDLIENNTRRIEILEEMARSLYREWFVKFRFPGHEQVQMVDSELGLIPEGWDVVCLGKLASFQTGKLNSNAAKPNGVYPFFTCSQEIFRTDTYSFDTECVLLAGNNANGVFHIKYFKGKFDAYQRTYVIRSLNQHQVTNYYLYFAIKAQLEHLKSISTGSATKFLTLTILNNLNIIVSLPDIQYKFAKFISVVFSEIELLQAKNDNLRQTRDLLLPRLISGEIDVENLDIKTGEIAA